MPDAPPDAPVKPGHARRAQAVRARGAPRGPPAAGGPERARRRGAVRPAASEPMLPMDDSDSMLPLRDERLRSGRGGVAAAAEDVA